MLNFVLHNQKKFLLIVSLAFVLINLPLLLNSTFISDDYSVIYLAEKDPFPVFTYYENGLENLIKNFQPEAFKYRPLTSLSLFLNESVTGLNSLGFHIVSLLLHLCVFVLLFQIVTLLLQLTKQEGKSLLLLLPLFYLINPSCANEISWIATRSDLLVVLFGIASLYFSLKLLQTKNNNYLFLSLLCFVFALMSKENGIFIPFLEIIIILQLFLINKDLTSQKKNLFFLSELKLGVLIIYFLMRQYLSSPLSLSPLKIIGISEFIPVTVKTLLFVLLPMDSGSLTYMLDDSKVFSVLIVVLSILPLGVYLFYIFRSKNKMILHFAALLSIWLCSTIIFILLGGISHRLLILTIAFSIPSVCLGLIALNSYKLFQSKSIYSILILYFLFYLSGYLFISNKWVTNMKTEKECMNSLEQNFDLSKKYIALTYPHSLSQTYCFSDIGLAMYYRKNHSIGKYENFVQGAAINSYSSSQYKTDYEFSKKDANSFNISSIKNDFYFTPGAYFTLATSVGEKFILKEDLAFVVNKNNSKDKPLNISLNNVPAENSIYLLFNKSKFEQVF